MEQAVVKEFWTYTEEEDAHTTVRITVEGLGGVFLEVETPETDFVLPVKVRMYLDNPQPSRQPGELGIGLQIAEAFEDIASSIRKAFQG